MITTPRTESFPAAETAPMDALMPTYARLPVRFVQGRGAWLEDDRGRHFLDALSGIAVCNLGHAHPDVAEAVAAQAHTLLHTSNLYQVPAQEELSRALCTLTEMDRAFFCNSGAEANEAAIKLARRYGSQRGIEAPEILVMDGAFHGRTLGALAATGNPKAQETFGPLPAGFRRVPYGDAEAVRALADTDRIAAILVEPIQGEGGVVVPPDDYLQALRSVCDERGWLLMVDEVQTGTGRTGHFLASQGVGVQPDVVTLAKGLANGVPIGACLARGPADGVLTAGTHGTTFGGNPLAARAALAVLHVLQRDALMARAVELGQRIRNGLADRLASESGVRAIRGRGLMIGIELDVDATPLPAAALDAGVLLNATAGSVVRLLPPLILDDADAEHLIDEVSRLVRERVTNARQG